MQIKFVQKSPFVCEAQVNHPADCGKVCKCPQRQAIYTCARSRKCLWSNFDLCFQKQLNLDMQGVNSWKTSH